MPSRRPLPSEAAHRGRRQRDPRRARRRQPHGAGAMTDDIRNRDVQELVARDYEWGFSSDVEQEFAPKGLSEDTVRFISGKKSEPEWMLEWRLKAYRAWLEMEGGSSAKLDIPEIDYQDAYYYAQPKDEPEPASLVKLG